MLHKLSSFENHQIDFTVFYSNSNVRNDGQRGTQKTIRIKFSEFHNYSKILSTYTENL